MLLGMPWCSLLGAYSSSCLVTKNEMTTYLVFDPPDTPFPTHEQRVTLMALAGLKGAKAYREAVERVRQENELDKLDITTATKSQLDHLIALMSEYPDLEEEWQNQRRP